jgi:hypothetical protein
MQYVDILMFPEGLEGLNGEIMVGETAAGMTLFMDHLP